jgi:hypothetical protein
MLLWPQYKIEDIADMSYEQKMFLLDCQDEVITFRTMEDYQKWMMA